MRLFGSRISRGVRANRRREHRQNLASYKRWKKTPKGKASNLVYR